MALSVVQGTAFASSATGTTIVSFPATTVNNLVVFNIKSNNTPTITSVNDTAGNAYTFAGSDAAGGTIKSWQYYGLQTTGGATAGTVVYSGTQSGQAVNAIEISGVTSGKVIDQTSSGTGQGANLAVTSFTTQTPQSIVIGGGGYALGNLTWTAGANYTLAGTASGFASEYRIISSSSAETVPITGTRTTPWVEVASNYNAAAATGAKLIQSTGTAVLGIGSTSTTWASSTTSGNLIVVGISLTNAAVLGTVSSITDNQSNTYVKAITGTLSSAGDVLDVELWYAKNIVGGAGSVTVNHTIDNCSMFSREYSGFDTLDKTNSASGSNANPNSGTSPVTLFSNELVIIVTGDDKGAGQTWTTAGNFGNMVGTATTITGLSMEDNIVTPTGAQTGTLVLGATANWDSLLATFYSSGGVPSWQNMVGVGN